MLIRRALACFVLPVTGLALAACGSNSHGDMNATTSGAASRTIAVDMTDLAFSPTTISVAAGETLKFVFTNRGKVAHDAFIGDAAAQMQHGAEMNSGTGSMAAHAMNGGNGSVTVKPGKSGSMTMSFDTAATLELGCHQPGHYEAGMKATVNVA